MAQTFFQPVPALLRPRPLGSVDDESAGGDAYTEIRLAPIANEGPARRNQQRYLSIFCAAIFDACQRKPTVLPALRCLLLLNGCTGIAVAWPTQQFRPTTWRGGGRP